MTTTQTTINLYEAGGGQLAIVSDTPGFDGRTIGYETYGPVPGSTFADDAAALAALDTDDWTIGRLPHDWQPGDDWTLVASCSEGHVTVYSGRRDEPVGSGAPGYSARDYIAGPNA